MTTFLKMILEWLFGCHHGNLSRVFKLGGATYQVCCDCGARFEYSWQTMSRSMTPTGSAPRMGAPVIIQQPQRAHEHESVWTAA